MKAKKNTQYTIARRTYNEAEALKQLLEATDAALNDWLEEVEASADRDDDVVDVSEFTITVGGVQTAFVLGGPQVAALHQFVKHIASEKTYYVDISTNTVEIPWQPKK